MRRLILGLLLLCAPCAAFAQMNGGLMSSQSRGTAAITGGTIDGTTIGGTTAAAGTFTSLTSGQPALSNLFIGSSAGNQTATGGENAGGGRNSLAPLTSGANNACWGPYSCASATTMLKTAALGDQALYNATDASYNVAFGYFALWSAEGDNATVRYNACGGYQACTGDSAATGRLAAPWSTGNSNAVWGAKAMRFYTTASSNSFFGAFAGENITTGGNNSSLGYQSLGTLATGVGNAVVGDQGFWQVTNGSNNSGLGRQHGWSATSISGSVFIGYRSGFYENTDNTLMIDNTSRASAADARIKALIYGLFNASTQSQFVRVNGAFQLAKITAVGAAPGADVGRLELVCGTNAGTAKLQAAAGTSATAVTVLDNIGAGVTGC